jgi:hypothetical protein
MCELVVRKARCPECAATPFIPLSDLPTTNRVSSTQSDVREITCVFDALLVAFAISLRPQTLRESARPGPCSPELRKERNIANIPQQAIAAVIPNKRNDVC